MIHKLGLIYTGGTIGASVKQCGEFAKDLNLKRVRKELESKISLLRDRSIEYVWKNPVNVFSERMIASDWKSIAQAIDEAIKEGVSGIVVLHGTDTMAYTAAALSFMLQGVKVPVVLTGANEPLIKEETDATRNMTDAIFVAKQRGLRGVFVVFSGHPKRASYIHLGTRVRKYQFTSNCYMSVNAKPIGKVERNLLTRTPYIRYMNRDLLERVTKINRHKEYLLRENVCDEVFLFKVHPSFRATQIGECPGKGIILELYNSGTGCDIHTERYNLLQNIEKQKAPIFATSQQLGSIDMSTYESSIRIRDAGVTQLGDMTTEAALAKLIWVLGQTQEIKNIKDLMLENLAGEISR